MLIGVSGKIGSGKDLVGEIIQQLIWYKKTNTAMDSFNYESFQHLQKTGQYQHNLYSYTGVKIKKFADNLKDMVCLLLGCTRENLEDREYKEAPLPRESGWWTYKNMTTGEVIPWRQVPDPQNWLVLKTTPRIMMQRLGTEAGREVIHPEIWVNALFSKYKESKPPIGDTYEYSHAKCVDCEKPFNGYKRQFICNSCHSTHNWYPDWIVTDMRFPNELDAIKSRGGITIRLERNLIKQGNLVIEHPSETALDNATFDYTINNSGTIDDLIGYLKTILTNHNII